MCALAMFCALLDANMRLIVQLSLLRGPFCNAGGKQAHTDLTCSQHTTKVHNTLNNYGSTQHSVQSSEQLWQSRVRNVYSEQAYMHALLSPTVCWSGHNCRCTSKKSRTCCGMPPCADRPTRHMPASGLMPELRGVPLEGNFMRSV